MTSELKSWSLSQRKHILKVVQLKICIRFKQITFSAGPIYTRSFNKQTNTKQKQTTELFQNRCSLKIEHIKTKYQLRHSNETE